MAQATTKVGVVIGTGGLGLDCARRVAKGRHLWIADYSETTIASVLKSLRDEGHTVDGYQLDIVDFGAVEKFAKTVAAVGHIDAIVLTAGLGPAKGTEKMIYEVNLLGFVNVMDAFYQVASEGTSFVGISSIAAHHIPAVSEALKAHFATAPRDKLLVHPELNHEQASGHAYARSKLANQLRVEAAARAWGSKGARINTVSPGAMDNPMLDAELVANRELKTNLVDRSALRRKGKSKEVAGTVAFLVGPDSSFITGTNILVDGGQLSSGRWNWDAIIAGQES